MLLNFTDNPWTSSNDPTNCKEPGCERPVKVNLASALSAYLKRLQEETWKLRFIKREVELPLWKIRKADVSSFSYSSKRMTRG